jgi:hypothetical protein
MRNGLLRPRSARQRLRAPQEPIPTSNAVVVPIPGRVTATTASHRVFVTNLPQERFIGEVAPDGDKYSSESDAGEVNRILADFICWKRQRIEISIQQLDSLKDYVHCNLLRRSKILDFLFLRAVLQPAQPDQNSLSPEHKGRDQHNAQSMRLAHHRRTN